MQEAMAIAGGGIPPQRIQALNKAVPRRGAYVLYWMQAAQRAECNHALEYAVREANLLGKPLVAYFGLTESFPDANLRHYSFMVAGLRETEAALRERGIRLVFGRGHPPQGVAALSRQAALAVVDRGYTRLMRQWRGEAARAMICPLVQVETETVVPVEVASSKAEYAAATLRPRLARQFADYLIPLAETELKKDSLSLAPDGVDALPVERLLEGLDIDRSVPASPFLTGGTRQAGIYLEDFLSRGLSAYAARRNDPAQDHQSRLSPYLHFGQISPLFIALKVLETREPGGQAYLEELLVRRELSINHAFFNPLYDSYDGVVSWARQTLREHSTDERPYLYSQEELEQARTHDVYWNAAQREMVVTGKMHGYMRMYWGKKIIEWSPSPETAFARALYLNNKYELDGRDPNSYAGIAWCFGNHDRPWARRPVFGTVRYMNAAGLRRKFDMDAYLARVARLVPAAGSMG